MQNYFSKTLRRITACGAITLLILSATFTHPLYAHIGAIHNFAQDVELKNRDYLTLAEKEVSKQRAARPASSAQARDQACQNASARLLATTKFISSQTADEVSRLDRILDASITYLATKNSSALAKETASIQDRQHAAQIASISLSALQRKIDCNYADPAQLVAAYRLGLADTKQALESYRSELIIFLDKALQMEAN